MNVILQQRVANLGGIGDVVTVKPGFARNYLIPKALALRATPEILADFESRRADLERQEAEKLAASQARAEALAALNIEISANASEEGKLFGSIAARDIAAAVSEKGVALSKAEVCLPEGPIRMTGEYTVQLQLDGDVNATVAVQVVKEA